MTTVLEDLSSFFSFSPSLSLSVAMFLLFFSFSSGHLTGLSDGSIPFRDLSWQQTATACNECILVANGMVPTGKCKLTLRYFDCLVTHFAFFSCKAKKSRQPAPFACQQSAFPRPPPPQKKQVNQLGRFNGQRAEASGL